MIIEKWKNIKDFPNYQISNLGRVKSKERTTNVKIKNVKKILRKEIILKPIKDKKGYLNVILYNKNGYKHFKIHRLVAEYFIPMINGKEYVNHIDGIKTNNIYKNLEWCTIKENNKHAIEKGLVNLNLRKENMSKLGKKRFPNRRKKIKQYDKNNNFIKEWISTREASKELGISENNISNCVTGRTLSAGGYVWKR